MGRPRTPWSLPIEEVAERYRNGESLQSLATRLGFRGYNPVQQALREHGVTLRSPGGRKGREPTKPSIRVVRVCARADCTNEFTVYPSSNKRFCQPRCRYTDDRIASLLSNIFSGKHRLSDIDPIARTATCGVCGPVNIRRRDKVRVHSGRPLWRCRTAEKARDWARQYGLNVEDVRGLLDVQGGACAICQRGFARQLLCGSRPQHRTGSRTPV